MRKILSLILLSFLTTAPLLAFENTDTTLLERGYETAWSQEDVVDWITPSPYAKDASIICAEVLPIYGLHSGYADQQTYYNQPVLASDTISARDYTAGVLNIDAQWVSYGTLGRYYTDGNWAFFRVGNVVLAHNAQETANEFAYSVDGMATYTRFGTTLTGTAGVWGGRITTISTIPFVNISMQLDMPHNKLVYLRISSADAPTKVLFEVKNLSIVGQDWTKIILQSGMHKSKSINGSPNMFLKKIRITETDEVKEKAVYRLTYKLDGQTINDNSVVYSGFQGETIEMPTYLWLPDPVTNVNTKYYVIDPSNIYLEKSSKQGTNSFKFSLRKANIYTYKVTAPALGNIVLACDSSIEGEPLPTLRWNKYYRNESDGAWYETQAPYIWEVGEEVTKTITRSFTKSDISYFWDTSDMVVHISHTGGDAGNIAMEGSSYSGGYTKRHYCKDPSWFAQGIFPDGGVFEVKIPWQNIRTVDSYIELDTYEDSIPADNDTYTVGSIAEQWYDDYNAGLTAYGSGNEDGNPTSGIETIEGFEVPINSGLILRYTNIYNSNAYLDYVTFKWMDYLRDNVAMQVTPGSSKKAKSVNLRSFICDKNYIFSKCDGISAYRLDSIFCKTVPDPVTNEDTTKVYASFSEIEGATPIGTLCVLAGTPGEIYGVPYVNHEDPLKEDNVVYIGGTEWVQKLENNAKGSPLAQTTDWDYFCLSEYNVTDPLTGENVKSEDGTDSVSVKFCKINPKLAGGIVSNNAVYFKIPTTFFTDHGLSKSKAFSCVFNNKEMEVDNEDFATPDGILEIATVKNHDRYTYNLNGQRVSYCTKGFVIRNGKKYLNK